MKKLLILLALALLLPATYLAARDPGVGGFIDYSGRPPYIYDGPRDPMPGPLAFAIQIPTLKNFDPVVMVGKISKEISEIDHYYDFYDTTGHTTLKILPAKWGSLTVGPNDIILIRGKIDDLGARPVVEVEQVDTRNHYQLKAMPPRGPLPMGVVSVEFAKTLPNTAPLALEGYIDQRMSPGKLLFHDRTGSITLNVEESSPLVAGPYDPGDVVIAEGRMNTAVSPAEMDVDVIVDRSNYDVVDIQKDVVAVGGDTVVAGEAEVEVPVRVDNN